MELCTTCNACASDIRDRDNLIPVCPSCDKFIEKEKGELLGTVCVHCRQLHHVNCLAWEATLARDGTKWNLLQFEADSKDESMGCVSEIVCPICPTCCPIDEEGNCSDKDRASVLASAEDFMKDFDHSSTGSSSNGSFRSRDCRTSSSTPTRYKIAAAAAAARRKMHVCERVLRSCNTFSSNSENSSSPL